MAKTLKVRIAVAIDGSGDWSAVGCNVQDEQRLMDAAIECVYGIPVQEVWVEAEVPPPEEVTVKGTVSREQESNDG